MSGVRDGFADMAGRLFAAACPIETVRAAERGAFPEALWIAVEEAGIPLMLVPEAKGGIGASVADAAVILRAAGRAAAPVPIVETMVANQLLVACGQESREGPLGLTFLGPESAAGQLRGVAWGRRVGAVVVVARDGAGAGIHLLRPVDAAVTTGTDIAGEARDDIAPAAEPPLLARLDAATVDAVGFRSAALLRAAQMLGALDWVLERTVAYAGERRQFGREIARFQAVQQHLADLAGQVAAATAITEAALEAGEGEAAEALLAAARSRLGDSVDAAFGIAHQVHGAIGFSHDYALNFRTRRLQAWRDEFGTVPEWRCRLAARFLGLRGVEVWPAVVAAGA